VGGDIKTQYAECDERKGFEGRALDDKQLWNRRTRETFKRANKTTSSWKN
jgi:hypothetical protein